MSVERLERAAATAAWVSAALRGATSVEQALDVLHSFSPHLLFWPHDGAEPLTLPFALARWRHLGLTGWQYVPAAPGDPNGLPGPAAFSATAIESGAGLVALGSPGMAGPPLGLVPGDPDEESGWQEVLTDRAVRRDETTPADAERMMLETLNRTVALVEDNDLSRGGADIDEVRTSWADSVPPPPGISGRSERLIQRSRRVLGVVEVAKADEGGSRTLAEMQARRHALDELERSARRAHAAAWNAGTAAVAGAR